MEGGRGREGRNEEGRERESVDGWEGNVKNGEIEGESQEEEA